MREYDDDDNIRLYAPVLQRVIILAAVVIAVPVMMWTITTFIRSYVARPQVPTFQHLTLTEAAQSPPTSPLAATPPSPPPVAALADTGMTADGSRTPPADTGSLPAAPATAAPSPPSVPTMAGAAVENPSQGAASTPPPAMASPDAPGPPTVAKPAGLIARLTTNGPAKPPPASGAAPAWPNPSAGGPPSSATQQPPDAMTETASTEALPPPQPLKGHIPLPRGRPAAIASAATEDMTPPGAAADTAATDVAATTDALPPPRPIKGRIPLPRRRPAVVASLAATGSVAPPTPTGRAVPMPKTRPVEAPPDAPPAPVSSPYGYHPGLDGGR